MNFWAIHANNLIKLGCSKCFKNPISSILRGPPLLLGSGIFYLSFFKASSSYGLQFSGMSENFMKTDMDSAR